MNLKQETLGTQTDQLASPSQKVEAPIYKKEEMNHNLLIVPGRSGNDHFLECSEAIEILTEAPIHPWEENTFNMIVVLTAPGFLVHPEHDTVVLPAGKYGFSQQVEYNPILEKMTVVFD